MDKFSFYDFVSFILPGGTFIIFSFYLLAGLPIELLPDKWPGAEIIALPFLLSSYMIGHLLNILGKLIENIFYGQKTALSVYFKRYTQDTERIDQKCQQLFQFSFLDQSKNIDTKKSASAFGKIYAYLETQGKDAKVKILMSQYGFFRNATPIWFVLLIMQILIIILHSTGLFCYTYGLGLISVLSFLGLGLFIASIVLQRQRKILMIKYTYRTFLSL